MTTPTKHDWVVIDLETAPLPRAQIDKWLPDWEEWSDDMFDPSQVKVGNYKPSNPKIEEKIEKARAEAERAHFSEQEQKRSELIDKAALHPERGWIFGAGIATPDYCIARLTLDPADEKNIIEMLWELVWNSRTLVNHNLLGFDLPFLFARSFALGIHPPFPVSKVTPWSGQQVYCAGQANPITLLDTQQIAAKSIYRQGSHPSLNWCAKFFDLEPKIDLDGELPWDVAQRDFSLACDYTKQDAALTRDVAKRLQVI